MGLLSTLRAAPKSATIRAQLEQNTAQRTATEARLAAARDAWRRAVLDGTDAEKADARAKVRGVEYDLEELQLQRDALAKLLEETEAVEAVQAAEAAWAADVKATRDARARTEKLLAEYEKQASALALTVRGLYDLAVVWGDDVERRHADEGRLTRLLDEANVPARPGATRTGRELWREEGLRKIPRLDEGHGPWYEVTPY